ncbi:MAG TPA: hypothetical protein VES42_24335 [Pilimelia sp.]|nr:hypothetical protein [Pilimelia sp.]
MTGPAWAREPICFFYGAGRLDALSRYARVVLQPEFYPPAELATLAAADVQTLAYLSLSEDTGPPAPWQRPMHNPDWGGAYVQVGHPGWVEHVVGQATAAVSAGFGGLFLDTLNVELTFPEDVPHLLTLIGAIRAEAKPGYLLANRGFGLLPALAEQVDGVLFESFTARWTDEGGYAAWPPDVLEHHAQIAEQLLALDVDLYALDYADSPGLAAFASRRAQQFGLLCVVSDKALSRV